MIFELLRYSVTYSNYSKQVLAQLSTDRELFMSYCTFVLITSYIYTKTFCLSILGKCT